MKGLYSAQNLVLVENIKNVLKRHEIESTITNQYLSAAVGEIPPNEAWPRLWVSDQEVERAKKIIEDAEKNSTEGSICPKCGEEVEGQFAVCWKCGTDLD